VADQPLLSAEVLGELRRRLGGRLGLIDSDANELTWIVNWPLVEWNPEEERWDPHNHPFTSPDGAFDPADPGAARADGRSRSCQMMSGHAACRGCDEPHTGPFGATRILPVRSPRWAWK